MRSTRRRWFALTLALLVSAPPSVDAAESYKRGYSLPHKDLCRQMGFDLRLLILVASPLNNAAQRDAIRFSWGHYARSSHVAVAFILGAPQPHMLKELAAEDSFYGDLIIGNSADSYPVFKMTSMLEWMHTYCSYAPRLFTTNDRVFTNVVRLLEFAESPENVHVKLTVWGDFVISNNDIRGADVYLLTNDSVGLLLLTATRVTSKNGVVVTAEKSRDITRHNVPNFINNLQQSCNVKLNLACHIFFYNQQYDLWQTITDSRNITERLYYTKDVSIILSSGKPLRPMKPFTNTGILILSLLFLLICIF